MISIDVGLDRGGFSLDVALETDARVVGLYGPSGSGKTTLLLALAGLLNPRRGRIEIDGEILFDAARGRCVPPQDRGLGFVFQEGRLFPHLTVRQNLMFGRPRPGAAGPGLGEVVDLLELEPLLDRAPRQLSGGQARLVAVGRALLARPRLLLLDEPLTGLDPRRRDRVLAFLLRLREAAPTRILYVSHMWSDFLALVDEVFTIEGGSVRGHGAPRDLTRSIGPDSGAGAQPLETTWGGRVTAVSGGEARVDCDGIEALVRLPGAVPGDRALIAIPAADVLVSMDPVPRTSARNRWSGRVSAVHPGPTRVWIEVDLGPRIWAEITPTSSADLGLRVGSPVELLVKTAALRAVSLKERSPGTSGSAGEGNFG